MSFSAVGKRGERGKGRGTIPKKEPPGRFQCCPLGGVVFLGRAQEERLITRRRPPPPPRPPRRRRRCSGCPPSAARASCGSAARGATFPSAARRHCRRRRRCLGTPPRRGCAPPRGRSARTTTRATQTTAPTARAASGRARRPRAGASSARRHPRPRPRRPRRWCRCWRRRWCRCAALITYSSNWSSVTRPEQEQVTNRPPKNVFIPPSRITPEPVLINPVSALSAK